MNSVARPETVVVALILGFCFVCESTLTQGPKSTSVLFGETVKLECFTADKNYPPAWSHQKVGSGERKFISMIEKQGDLILPKLMNGYGERRSISANRDTGEYSLQITDAKPEDAGSYSCIPRGGLEDAHLRSAELSVFELPECASNVTDAVGENDCHKEPDVIELSCKFRLYGNHLPKTTWINANHTEKVITIDTPTTDATGMATSKLIVRGNYTGLDETSFKCIVSSTENVNDTRFSCDTPKINVIEISNLTESKSLVAPEEVECTRWSKLNASGCQWFRGDDHKQEVYVTSKSMLNLHRSDMPAGTYVCFAECTIRGETCRVKLLKVSYQPPPPSQPESRIYVAVVVPALFVVGAIFIGLFFNRKNHKVTKSPKKIIEAAEMQEAVVYANGLSSQQVPLLSQGSLQENDSGISSQQGTPPGSLQENDSGISSQQGTPPGSTQESDSCHSSQQDIPPSPETPKDIPVTIDVIDAKLGGPTKSERLRSIEKRAEARMRANAARQRGENNQAFPPETDVAEGVAADKTKHE